MANHLPDEIISEILSPALKVSDATFSAITPTAHSPFMTFSESSSAFLLVSKAWLRVATPLLYNVVVLRSKAQAQALAATLKLNPTWPGPGQALTWGRFIKKLRVEGGFAISMFKILQSSKNITDLVLTLGIASSDNACGLIRGLPLVDPVRVVVMSLQNGKLAEALEKSIPTLCWRWHTAIGGAISEAVRQAPNLSTLFVRDDKYELDEVPEYMRVIAANPSLKRIRIVPPMLPGPCRQDFVDGVRKDAKLSALLQLGESILPLAPFVYPARLSANPIQEDAIWSRVLYFAIQSDTRWWDCPLAPILVCKMFARVGVPHLYAKRTLMSTKALNSFALQLERQPALGRSVRSLSLKLYGDLDVLKRVVEHSPGLTELHRLRGASLRSFNLPVSKKSSAADPGLFALFPEMREFVWDSKTVFKTGPKMGPKLIAVDTFSLLASLTINTFEASFLDVLSHMELPALRTMAFPPNAVGGARFFERHGAKLRELTVSGQQLADPKLSIWRNCPSMTVLGVACDQKHSAGPSDFKTAIAHAHVERIVFRTPNVKYKHSQDLYHFCSSAAWAKPFHQLREIEHPCCEWPTTEREISKNEWFASPGPTFPRRRNTGITVGFLGVPQWYV
ncbi:hypothetical protein C8R47DRAFT_1219515 [Mycena vitilis]|nr:hypothetical protein C8R47DRAFT_1219515 [Mycena vitilis]